MDDARDRAHAAETEASLRIPLHEESLEAATRPVELGRVRVTKRVLTEPWETTVEVGRDDVRVERMAVDRPVETAPEPWYEGETLVVPVVEEVVVTETRLVVREEVRITRRRVIDQLPVRAERRKEIVDVETLPPDPT
jgi:uncharacterized protein (TIGR02271 family)